MKRHRALWTKEELDRLRSMCHAGKTYPEIARKLGRTPGACQAKASTLGVKGHTGNRHEFDRIRKERSK